jgi:hypothetical protein
VLRDMAAHHPEYFAAVEKSGAFVQDNVRIGRDGFFVADRKVADLEQVVETITPNDVREVWAVERGLRHESFGVHWHEPGACSYPRVVRL